MQTVYPSTSQEQDQMSQVSLRKGYWFYFEHEGNDISMFGSVWSGKEKVFFNNKEVSAFRNLTKLKSEHRFETGGHCYELKTHMTSMLKGQLEVSLYCDGELIQTESVAQVSKVNKKSFFLTIGSFLVLGYLFGYTVAKLLI